LSSSRTSSLSIISSRASRSDALGNRAGEILVARPIRAHHGRRNSSPVKSV
jgi:hypothetical protein